MSDIDPRGSNVPAPAVLASGRQISMQVLQDIYNEITGKTEKLAKNFNMHHKTTFQDLKQLNIKVQQILEQYNVVSRNCSITMYHIDEGKEEFSSFERFELFDQSSLSAIENVRLKYNFLIILPQTSRAQSYAVEINVFSRAAFSFRAENEPGTPMTFFQLFSNTTGRAEIGFVDYTVARNIMVAIEHWFASLDQNKPNKFVEFLKKHSELFPVIFRYITATVLLAYFFYNLDKWLTTESSALELFTLSILCFGAVYVVAGIAYSFGRNLERRIDTYQPVSYLKLNRGDDNVISKQLSSNKKIFYVAIFNIALAIIANVLTISLVRFFGFET